MADDTRRPVHVLTGFLGSGKTTLLRHILRDPAYAGTAVLINEFGEVGLDHLLLGRIEGEPVLLDSGCVCCTIRGDLVAALRRLTGPGAPAFGRVVIETTGLADPTPVLATLLGDLAIRRAFRPGRLLACVDAVHGLAGLGRHPVLRKQAAAADVIVVTKSDLADDRPLRRALGALNPLAAIHVARFGAADPAMLFGGAGGGQDWLALAALPPPPHGATAFSIELAERLDYAAFALWFSLLVHAHGSRLLRVKAILDVAGSDSPVALHAVQHVIHAPEHLDAWTGPPRSVLVFITDGLRREPVAASLAAFLRAARN